MFSEELESMVVLSVYRRFALGPVSPGGLCPKHLPPHSTWHLLVTDIFCLGIKSTLFSFKCMSALWNISKWCCAIPYWCLLLACWAFPWSWVTAGQKKVMGLEILKLCCKAACLELLPVPLLPHVFFLLGKMSCLCVCRHLEKSTLWILSPGRRCSRKPRDNSERSPKELGILPVTSASLGEPGCIA